MIPTSLLTPSQGPSLSSTFLFQVLPNGTDCCADGSASLSPSVITSWSWNASSSKVEFEIQVDPRRWIIVLGERNRIGPQAIIPSPEEQFEHLSPSPAHGIYLQRPFTLDCLWRNQLGLFTLEKLPAELREEEKAKKEISFGTHFYVQEYRWLENYLELETQWIPARFLIPREPSIKNQLFLNNWGDSSVTGLLGQSS